MSGLKVPSRTEWAGRLRNQGNKIVGYFCCYTPVELITAATLIPYRLTGAMGKPIVHADGFLETVMCPFVRSVLEMKINGEYDFIDGLVMGNTCDTINFSYTVFNDYWKPAFTHFLDIPHKATESAQLYYRSEFDRFRRALCEYAGVTPSDEALRRAISLHNRNRALQRELYNLRKEDTLPVSASEVLDIIICNLGIPVEEGNRLLENTMARIEAGEARHPSPGIRLLLWGSQLDGTKILDLVEDCGANVVVDDLCIGSRNFRCDVEITSDPMEGLTRFYSNIQVCARTFRDNVDERFSHIKDLAISFRVDGAILYILRYCDINGFDMPFLKEYLRNIEVPVLVIEDDYTGGALAQVKTRVQAFVEMLEQG